MTTRTIVLVEQSGVIPYRIMDGQIEVMLITSSGGKRWVIPKGLIEPEKRDSLYIKNGEFQLTTK